MDDLTKYGGDGFGGYTSETEGDYLQLHSGFMRGTKLKFTNTCAWDPHEYAHPKRLLAYGMLKAVQFWGRDKRPIADETIIVPQNKRFPDVDEWNGKLPQSEWVDGPVPGVKVGRRAR
jgi:hypothetical protein